jgi:starvation-inducible outer membrane lipoprotein
MSAARTAIGYGGEFMKLASVWLAMGLLLSPLLVACGEGETVSDLKFSDVRKAKDGGPDALRSYVQEIRGKKVRWSGVVTEAVREHGDDYMEIAFLLVDLDAKGEGSPDADVIFEIKPSQIDALPAGQDVTFVGAIRELDRRGDGTMLMLEVDEVGKSKSGG